MVRFKYGFYRSVRFLTKYSPKTAAAMIPTLDSPKEFMKLYRFLKKHYSSEDQLQKDLISVDIIRWSEYRTRLFRLGNRVNWDIWKKATEKLSKG